MKEFKERKMDNSKEYVQDFSEVALHCLSAIERKLLETMMRNAYLQGRIDAYDDLYNEENEEDEDGTGRDGLPIKNEKEVPDCIKEFIEDLHD